MFVFSILDSQSLCNAGVRHVGIAFSHDSQNATKATVSLSRTSSLLDSPLRALENASK